MVAALVLCCLPGDCYFGLVLLCWVECWQVVLVALFCMFFLFAISQCTLAQKVRIRAQPLLLLAMNLRAIPLVHLPALSAFLRLHQVDIQLAKGNQVRSDNELTLELWL